MNTNLDELELLASVSANNENVLKYKTLNIRDKVRDWCIGELTKIEAEEKKIVDFVNAHMDIFVDRCGTPLFYSFGMEYSAIGSGNNLVFKTISACDKCFSFEGYEMFFKSISVHNWTTKVAGCYDCMNGDIEYWTKMKKVIDFRKWQLEYVSLQIKKLIESVIEFQRKRMDGIVNVCKEIDEENANAKEIEVTIKIRV